MVVTATEILFTLYYFRDHERLVVLLALLRTGYDPLKKDLAAVIETEFLVFMLPVIPSIITSCLFVAKDLLIVTFFIVKSLILEPRYSTKLLYILLQRFGYELHVNLCLASHDEPQRLLLRAEKVQKQFGNQAERNILDDTTQPVVSEHRCRK